MSKSSTTQSSEESKESCPHCVEGRESYRCYGRNFVYDVDRARTLVSDGREPVEVDDESVRKTLEDTRIYKEHLSHVDIRYPGIIAHVSCVTPEGEFVRGHVLIDGNHRAARSLQLEKPFFAYVLSEEESEQIVTRKVPLPALETTCGLA